MDEEQLRECIVELGNALDHAIEKNDAVNAAIDRIKEGGYNLRLLAEFTIAYEKCAEGEVGKTFALGDSAEEVPAANVPDVTIDAEGNVHFHGEGDAAFLKYLKIDTQGL